MNANPLLSQLNPPQQEAVLHTEGPLLIFAGAGSGKTRVLVQRMAHLIRNHGVKPWEIFAVTFTNKAAGEMKERVGQVVGQRADDLWISTFHSAGVRILRRHIEKLNYGPTFVIYDDSDQMTLLKNCLDELHINPKLFHPRAIQSRIDNAKNELIEPEDYPSDDFFDEKVAQVYLLYQEKLRQNNALDFGDLLRLPVKLFQQHPEILNEYTQRLRFFMVDEYQDTNHAQYCLMKLLAEARQNLCVVGDDDQSIYGWRGADIRNILEFAEDFPGARIVKLEQNYRSTHNILEAAGAVVEKIEQRQPKKLWTENTSGEKVTLYRARDEKDEARFVVEQIEKYQKQGLSLNEMALFYRTNAQSRVFEDELRRHNLPYVIFGGVRFYDRAEIKDILAYLWVLANPADSLHLKRIINVPARGIGKTSIEKLERLAAAKNLSLRETLRYSSEAGLSARLSQKVLSLVSLLDHLQSAVQQEPLPHFVELVLEKTGYLEALRQENTLESEARLENLEEFMNVVEDYQNSASEPSLADFLDQVSLVQGLDQGDASVPALRLMTAHLAKGLEFEVVFLVGMEEGLMPHSRSLDTPEGVDEERRLTYVGMTRAKQKLFLCHANSRRVFGREQWNLPSRFLDDVPESILEIEEAQDYFSESELFSQVQVSGGNSAFSFSGSTSLASREDPNNPYRSGVKVKHPIFGVGTVKACEGQAEKRKVTVQFPGCGIKKLAVNLAPLTVLGSSG